jgi:hypothetical protein
MFYSKIEKNKGIMLKFKIKRFALGQSMNKETKLLVEKTIQFVVNATSPGIMVCYSPSRLVDIRES